MTAKKAPSASRPARDPIFYPIGIAFGVAAGLALIIYFAPIDWARWGLAGLPEKTRPYIWPLLMLSLIFAHNDRQNLARSAINLLIVALVTGLYAALAYAMWQGFGVSPAILAVIGIVLAVATIIGIFEYRLERRVAAMGEKQVWLNQAPPSTPAVDSPTA